MDNYLRKSLFQTKDNILKGYCSRVGNGNNINVWEDSWLPYHDWFNVLIRKSLDTNVPSVRDLIDLGSHKWNTSLINKIFLHNHSQIINRIPIDSLDQKETLKWGY